MLYGAIRARLPFTLAEFTETSHEGQVISYMLLGGGRCAVSYHLYMILRSRQVFSNAVEAHRQITRINAAVGLLNGRHRMSTAIKLQLSLVHKSDLWRIGGTRLL